MSKKNLLRVGDWVEIVNPKVVTRVGYTYAVSDYKGRADELFGRELRQHIRGEFRLIDRALDQIAYGLAKSDGFGGRDRTLHLVEDPTLLGRQFQIYRVRIAKTGHYEPGYISHDTGHFASDWAEGVPAYLSSIQTHRLITLPWSFTPSSLGPQIKEVEIQDINLKRLE